MEIVYSSIRDLFRALFGVYSPVSYTLADGTSVVPAGAAGVDFEYVLSVCIFALVVYCLFRLLGMLFQRH